MSIGYKEYNNYSQQDKDSMRTLAADTSNANEVTIISQTDEVESLLSQILNKLTTIESDLITINSSIGGTTNEVVSQGQAIVQAIQEQ